jgi:hypothetical protein
VRASLGNKVWRYIDRDSGIRGQTIQQCKIGRNLGLSPESNDGMWFAPMHSMNNTRLSRVATLLGTLTAAAASVATSRALPGDFAESFLDTEITLTKDAPSATLKFHLTSDSSGQIDSLELHAARADVKYVAAADPSMDCVEFQSATRANGKAEDVRYTKFACVPKGSALPSVLLDIRPVGNRSSNWGTLHAVPVDYGHRNCDQLNETPLCGQRVPGCTVVGEYGLDGALYTPQDAASEPAEDAAAPLADAAAVDAEVLESIDAGGIVRGADAGVDLSCLPRGGSIQCGEKLCEGDFEVHVVLTDLSAGDKKFTLRSYGRAIAYEEVKVGIVPGK